MNGAAVSQGELLAGRLELPDVQPLAYALFAHCFTSEKDAVAATRISRALTSAGVAVLRFDVAGLGQSGGDVAHSNVTSNVNELVRAASFLRTNRQAPSILIGHSLGAAAVLVAALQMPEVRAVVTIGAPADPAHVPDLVGDGIAELSAALLVLHSPSDQIVSIDNARELFDAARHPKSFVSLDGADHLLTRAADAQFAADVIGAWMRRYVPAVNAQTEPTSTRLKRGTVQVTENGTGPYGQTITTNEHTLLADEPEPIGAGSGMSPYDLLLAALGACTSMTLRMYADRKEWPLERVEVTLRYSRGRTGDRANGTSAPASVEQIDLAIVVFGDLTAEQRESLLVIADKCPVHRTLRANLEVSTQIAPGEPSDVTSSRSSSTDH